MVWFCSFYFLPSVDAWSPDVVIDCAAPFVAVVHYYITLLVGVVGTEGLTPGGYDFACHAYETPESRDSIGAPAGPGVGGVWLNAVVDAALPGGGIAKGVVAPFTPGTQPGGGYTEVATGREVGDDLGNALGGQCARQAGRGEIGRAAWCGAMEGE